MFKSTITIAAAGLLMTSQGVMIDAESNLTKTREQSSATMLAQTEKRQKRAKS